MNFHEELQEQRIRAGLTTKEAADKVGLSVMDYENCENGAADMNIPKAVGMLACLGMEVDTAFQIAQKPQLYTVEELRAIKSPTLVKETEDEFIFIDFNADGMEYEIGKERVNTPEAILGWVFHMSEKKWVTRDHLRTFIALASSRLALEIHPI